MNDRDLLAAEHALGLLEGQALLEARGLTATDPGFAAAVDDWQERLAPLFDEVGEQAPRKELWQHIRAEIAAAPPGGGNVVALKRRLGMWQGLAAGASAIAASLALVVAFDATRPPAIVEPAAPIMLASLMSPSKDIMLSAALEADHRTLTLMPGKITPPPGRRLALWLIPSDGRPRSLGTLGGKTERMIVDPGMAEHFDEEPMLALTIEPATGAPVAQPSGPMVASGQLRLI